jgi:protein Mpv17
MPLAAKKTPALATASLCLAAPILSSAFVPLEGLSSHVIHGAHDAFHQAQHVAVPIVAKLQEAAAAIQSDPVASKVHDIVRHSAQNIHFNPANSKLLKSYGDLLVTHPLETKVGTAAVLATVGDAIAQKSSEASKEYDPTRGMSFALFAVMYTGAFQHYWFGWENTKLAFTAAEISPTLALLFASSAAFLPIAKLVLNQFVVVPFLYMPLFFAFTGHMAGLSEEESLARAKQMYGPILLRNYFYWLPAQFIQFAVIAPEWQIPYVCFASLIWTIILSSASSATTTPAKAAAAAVNISASSVEVIDIPAMGVLDGDVVTLDDIGDSLVEATVEVTDALLEMTSGAELEMESSKVSGGP